MVLIPPETTETDSDETGGVLVEFALVSLVLYLLLGATITFGSMMHTAQVVQDVARLAARELALTPLPAAIEFETALDATRDRIFDPDQLVVDLDELQRQGLDLDGYFAAAPIVNRALRPLFIFESIAGQRLLRLPGALLATPNPTPLNAGYTVGVPLVVARAAGGQETIRWLPVVEELRTDPNSPATGPFSADSTALDRGMVALRINVPDQSAAFSSFDRPTSWPPEPTAGTAHTADDSAVQVSPGSLPPYGTVITGLPDPDTSSIYAGRFGLGVQGAFARPVRPFRRVFSGQALFRREVFQ